MDTLRTVLVEEDMTFSFIGKISPCAILFDGHLRMFSWDPDNPTCVIKESSHGGREFFPLFAVDGILVTALKHDGHLPLCVVFAGSEPQLKITATLIILALLSYCQTKTSPSTVVLELCRSQKAERQIPSFTFLREMTRIGCAALHFIPIYAGCSAQARYNARLVCSLMTGITPLKFISFSSETEVGEWLESNMDELAKARLDLYSTSRMTYLVESFNSLSATWFEDLKVLSPSMFHFHDADEENCKGEEMPIASDSGNSSANRNRGCISGERGESHFSTLGGSESITAPKKFRAVLLETIPEEQ